MFGLRPLLATLVLLAATGCASAINYADPQSPIFVGRNDAEPLATNELKVVTFNIRFSEQVDRAAALLATNEALRRADVLLLQEMDRPGTEELARHLAMNYVYVPSAVHPRTGRDFGVAILSPWPIEDAHKVLLPGAHAMSRMRRAAAAATIRTAQGDVRVYAVHLETPFGASDATRRAQARAVLADASAWRGAIVIAGDFNGTDGAAELAARGLLWLTRRVHDTAGPFDFDHIVTRALCAARGPDVVRNPEVRRISDHRPLWAVLRPCA